MSSNIERKLDDPEFHSLVSKGSGKWSKIIKPGLPKGGDVLGVLSTAEKVTSIALSSRKASIVLTPEGDVSFALPINILGALVTCAKLKGINTKKVADALGEVKFQTNKKDFKKDSKFEAIYKGLLAAFFRTRLVKNTEKELELYLGNFFKPSLDYDFPPPEGLNQEPIPIDDTAAEQIDREQPITEQDQREEPGLESDFASQVDLKEVLERDSFGDLCIRRATKVTSLVWVIYLFLLVRGIYSRFICN
ncbi:MAG: hypothetical protein LBF94_04310 [Puniceicoccales bacterium]|jgi:hypothetical protein|nr:hypothetical protein [Puniceicoccales bacterium]